jgi:hypothetical protein
MLANREKFEPGDGAHGGFDPDPRREREESRNLYAKGGPGAPEQWADIIQSGSN